MGYLSAFALTPFLHLCECKYILDIYPCLALTLFLHLCAACVCVCVCVYILDIYLSCMNASFWGLCVCLGIFCQ